MPHSARTKLWQRVLDCVIGGLVAGIGVVMFGRWLARPIDHETYGLVWASLMFGSGIAVLVGSVLRTSRPGRRRSTGFQFELVGWGLAAFLIASYAVVDYSEHSNLALLFALLLSVTMLFGSWLRMLDAMREAAGRERRRR